MVERVGHPKPEGLCREEVIPLSEPVELRVALHHPRADELIKDSDYEGRQESEDHVVEGQRPRLVGDLPREVVEEGVLQPLAVSEREPAKRERRRGGLA